jgi:hypothetical protein
VSVASATDAGRLSFCRQTDVSDATAVAVTSLGDRASLASHSVKPSGRYIRSGPNVSVDERAHGHGDRARQQRQSVQRDRRVRTSPGVVRARNRRCRSDRARVCGILSRVRRSQYSRSSQLRVQFGFVGYLTVFVPPTLDVVATDVPSLAAENPHWSRSSQTCCLHRAYES